MEEVYKEFKIILNDNNNKFLVYDKDKKIGEYETISRAKGRIDRFFETEEKAKVKKIRYEGLEKERFGDNYEKLKKVLVTSAVKERWSDSYSFWTIDDFKNRSKVSGVYLIKSNDKNKDILKILKGLYKERDEINEKIKNQVNQFDRFSEKDFESVEEE